MTSVGKDLVQLARLALSEKMPDVRLFTARLVRKYRKAHPEIAAELESQLRSRPERAMSPLRGSAAQDLSRAAFPESSESGLSLLRAWDPAMSSPEPILADSVREVLDQLVAERLQVARLAEQGLVPTRSAIFVGPPGVGKTLTARWIAAQLGLPLLVLDLAAVISSFLGRSGANVRSAFDHARKVPCVLLLDEIDAIAKRRNDEADVGELKRLVTVIMQELDEWAPSGLLLAATNHGELIDRALWRRFDLIVEFPLPGDAELRSAIQRFAGNDRAIFKRFEPSLVTLFRNSSLSDVERAMRRTRRALALGLAKPEAILDELLRDLPKISDRRDRIDLAVSLARGGGMSQHRIADATGVSRDTIRKYAKRRMKEDR